MNDVNKIIFLDIDGPVIPFGCYAINTNASFDRTFSNVCIGYVRKICELTGAKIVTNSAHNYHYRDYHDDVNFDKQQASLKDDLIAAGIAEEHFHENWRTIFPNNKPFGGWPASQHPRLLAVYDWIKKNDFYGEDKLWVGFDDDDYAPHLDHVHLIDFDHGITLHEFRKTLQYFKCEAPLAKALYLI